MTLKDIVKVSCTNCKVYVDNKLVYAPFDGKLTPFLDRMVRWLDSEDDILLIGIEGGENHEKE